MGFRLSQRQAEDPPGEEEGETTARSTRGAGWTRGGQGAESAGTVREAGGGGGIPRSVFPGGSES